MTARISLALLVPILLGVGCASDNVGPGPFLRPVAMSSSSPPDSALGVADLDDFAMTMVFNQEVDPAEVRQNWIVPRPLELGSFLATGRRTLRWSGLELDPGVPVYTWFVDGADFAAPVTVRIYPYEEDRPAASIVGRVGFVDGRRSPRDAMLFVLPLAARGQPIPEGSLSLLLLPVQRAIRLKGPDPTLDTPVFDAVRYTIVDLESEAEYILVAIEDTDDDGYYVPGVDWWGYPRMEGRPHEPIAVSARVRANPMAVDAPAVFTIDFPGALAPEDF